MTYLIYNFIPIILKALFLLRFRSPKQLLANELAPNLLCSNVMTPSIAILYGVSLLLLLKLPLCFFPFANVLTPLCPHFFGIIPFFVTFEMTPFRLSLLMLLSFFFSYEMSPLSPYFIKMTPFNFL